MARNLGYTLIIDGLLKSPVSALSASFVTSAQDNDALFLRIVRL
jgi:hypothetical protein